MSCQTHTNSDSESLIAILYLPRPQSEVGLAVAQSTVCMYTYTESAPAELVNENAVVFIVQRCFVYSGGISRSSSASLARAVAEVL